MEPVVSLPCWRKLAIGL